MNLQGYLIVKRPTILNNIKSIYVLICKGQKLYKELMTFIIPGACFRFNLSKKNQHKLELR